MTLEEIKERINKINEYSYDDEMAHGIEDSLYQDFILFIANEDLGSISEKAKLILTTKDIKFSRWCA